MKHASRCHVQEGRAIPVYLQGSAFDSATSECTADLQGNAMHVVQLPCSANDNPDSLTWTNNKSH